MENEKNKVKEQLHYEEHELRALSGMGMLIINILLMIAAIPLTVMGIVMMEQTGSAWWLILFIVSILYLSIIGPILFAGIKVLKPNEALVFTLFGKYYGTLKGEGMFFVNPFVAAFNPVAESAQISATEVTVAKTTMQARVIVNKKISLKAMTLNNEKQKVNDQLGNPIIIGIVVMWRVVNTAKAVFNVDNYREYLSIQCDSALRNIVRLYPYDVASEVDEKSLRGSSQEVAASLKEEIQASVEISGLEIMEARITHLAYAPEIAASMLQRQQASAIIDARKLIVEGAVSMVEMALEKLSENNIVTLDEERKAAMVSNLLVVLCGNKDAQPIVNSGSIY